jgi:hypothetical protein
MRMNKYILIFNLYNIYQSFINYYLTIILINQVMKNQTKNCHLHYIIIQYYHLMILNC